MGNKSPMERLAMAFVVKVPIAYVVWIHVLLTVRCESLFGCWLDRLCVDSFDDGACDSCIDPIRTRLNAIEVGFESIQEDGAALHQNWRHYALSVFQRAASLVLGTLPPTFLRGLVSMVWRLLQ